MRLRLVLALCAVLALSAVALAGVSAGSASGAQAAATPWTGTVNVVINLDSTTSTQSGATIHTTYHDDSTYTLSGDPTADGLYPATLKGSGGGVLSGTPGGASDCVVPANPWQQWSYSGPASVSISYANGVFLVVPKTVDVAVTTISRLSSCSGSSDQTSTRTMPEPYYLSERTPQGQAAAATATSLVGSEDFAFKAGTGTVSWNLTRTSSGGVSGSGGGGKPAPPKPKPGPKPRRLNDDLNDVIALEPYIHTDLIGRRWIYGKGQVLWPAKSRIQVTLYQFYGGSYHNVGSNQKQGTNDPLEAIATVRCGKPYTAYKFKVVVKGWWWKSNHWQYLGTNQATKKLKC
jgi:hypothetical protein